MKILIAEDETIIRLDLRELLESAGHEVVAEARAQNGQLDDPKCRLFRIDHNGLKYAEDSGGDDRTDDCWR